MGSGSYSVESRNLRATSAGYYTKAPSQIFEKRQLDLAMNPNGIRIREARDSEEHPNSIPVILGLDVTGSMGHVPHHLIKDGLPTLMSGIIQAGIPDPQLLFTAVGDHEVDDAPLQVAQFESSDELLDQWLQKVYIESGGGGNAGESYALAWYFAGYHTATDHWDKRNKKGYLFTVGDEPVLNTYPKTALEAIMGTSCSVQTDITAAELLDAAREKWNVYHIHIRETGRGSREDSVNVWRELLGDNLIILEEHQKLPFTIADIVSQDVITSAPGWDSTSKQDPSYGKDTPNSDQDILL
jgi:hypothetical protein